MMSMKLPPTNHLALIAAVGIAAYFLMNRKATAAPNTAPRYGNVGQYGPRAPGVVYNPTGVAQPADAYYGLGRLLGGIFGGGNSSALPAPGQTPSYSPSGGGYTYGSNQAGPPAPESYIPDDALAANPPANVDPAMFEKETWAAIP